jgi:D-sedoheptulose 7-phosphate isomerase
MADFTKDINDYYAREIEVLKNLDAAEIDRAMNCLLDHYEKEGTVYVFGNGGSSATASHMVSDFNKGVSANLKKRFRLISLNDNVPTVMAVANDISFDDVFSYQLENKLRKDDLIVAISGSGNSRNVLKAVEYAKKQGVEVIGMTGYDGGKLDKLSDYHLHAPIDDMQITEDIHMAFNHMMMQLFWKYLETREGLKPEYKEHK